MRNKLSCDFWVKKGKIAQSCCTSVKNAIKEFHRLITFFIYLSCMPIIPQNYWQGTHHLVHYSLINIGRFLTDTLLCLTLKQAFFNFTKINSIFINKTIYLNLVFSCVNYVKFIKYIFDDVELQQLQCLVIIIYYR